MTHAQQRAEIRKMCQSLKKLLGSVQPVRALAILQKVGTIESEALRVSDDKLPATKAALHQLMRQLKDEGIINPQRWQEFFGLAD